MGEEWVCKVNNSILGRFWLWYLKRILNRESYTIRRRGRHTNRKAVLKDRWYAHDQNDIPVGDAKYWGIYLERKR